jgi:hypothetical protein
VICIRNCNSYNLGDVIIIGVYESLHYIYGEDVGVLFYSHSSLSIEYYYQILSFELGSQ